MNDWWNDPPEDDDGEIDDYEPDPSDNFDWTSSDFYDKYITCAHGYEPGNCEYCNILSDFLYDANRENQLK